MPALFEDRQRTSGVFAGRWVPSPGGGEIVSFDPTTAAPLGTVLGASPADCSQVIASARDAFDAWRRVPAPVRGELVRRIGNALRDAKAELATVITRETGKILPESLGEVQEMIDVADFAVGLSRQLYGKSTHSERSSHRMLEQWHPLGVVGV